MAWKANSCKNSFQTFLNVWPYEASGSTGLWIWKCQASEGLEYLPSGPLSVWPYRPVALKIVDLKMAPAACNNTLLGQAFQAFWLYGLAGQWL